MKLNFTYSALLLLLPVILFFSGCRQVQKQGDAATGSRLAAAMDSLRILDSLVIFNRVRDSAVAMEYAKRSLQIAQIAGQDDLFVKAYNTMGNAWSVSMMDSAFIYYTLALQVKPGQEDFPEKSSILYNLAMLYVASSNNRIAITVLDSALRSAIRFEKPIIVSNSLNALGNIYHDLGNGPEAVKMYDSAYKTAERRGLALQKAIALGNQAKLEPDHLVSTQKEQEAIRILQSCQVGPEQLAAIYINRGMELDEPDSAIALYESAIHLIKGNQAPLILLAAYNNLAYSYLEKGNPAAARQLLQDHAFPLANKIHDNQWIANLYDTYADVLSADGKFREALSFQKKAMELSNNAEQREANKQTQDHYPRQTDQGRQKDHSG
jgi:tetratricopeptide (TPR) repeat protein